LSKILCWNGSAYVEIPCTEGNYTKGLSEYHHFVLEKYAREQGLEFSTEDQRCAARVRLRDKLGSFANNRKMGVRRRAQRLLASPHYRSDGGHEHNLAEPSTDENVIPIETVSNRADGDRPEPTPVRNRKGQKKGTRSPGAVQRSTSQIQPAPPPTMPAVQATDPFASFDRGELLERAKKKLGEGNGA
jgi:putative transposase